MIGQPQLTKIINTVEFDTFPPSVILVGDSGCGKHTFCKELSHKFSDIEFRYVNEKITYDFVENCYINSLPIIYILNVDALSEKEQNALLKLFEEPPKDTKIIILTTSLSKLLPTIINRAIKWTFLPYSDDVLKTFLGNEDISILNIAKTPGQIINMTGGKFKSMYDLANLIIDKMCKAAVPNALSLTDKFNISGDNNDKYDLEIFLKLFKTTLLNRIKNNTVGFNVGFQMYALVSSALKDMFTYNVNKKYLIENLIIELKLVS